MMKSAFLLTACGLSLISCKNIENESRTATPNTPGTFSARPQHYVALPGQAATASETTSALDSAAASYSGSARQYSNAPIPTPRQVASTGLLSDDQLSITPASSAPYALQVLNGTQGRLFIEAQDDSGNIFPFGFMYAGQRIGTQPQEPRLIVGNLTLVVRDPDRPNAPELRRYSITPPAGYEGHTLGITILPGGRYRVMLDGQVYYASPEPDQSTAQ